MRRGFVILVIAAAIATVAAALASASALTYKGGSGRIAFAVNRGNVDIYSLLPNGDGVARLTSAPGFDACPSWSRDGKTIAYCSDASGAFEIWTMRADGSGKHRETNLNSNATFPDISPDGRRILFSDCARTCRVMVVDRATGKESVLVDNGRLDELEPTWSPDGRHIAFLRSRSNGPGQIFIARADGSRVRRLTMDTRPKGPFGPDWRPDGKLLAYTSEGDVWTVDLEGRTRRVKRSRVIEMAPTWSPDGARIAYRHRVGRTFRIYVMRANGAGARPLAPTLGNAQLVPSWQPLPRK